VNCVGAVALSHRAISTPQIFRHEAEDSHQSPNTAGNRTAFVPDLIDQVERPNSISQEILRPVILKIA
jgi:hypothetical protein